MGVLSLRKFLKLFYSFALDTSTKYNTVLAALEQSG